MDSDHEGYGPGHRGETALGVSSQWQAQAVLHVAEERPTASLRGKLLLVLCHLPIYHFKGLIFSFNSSFDSREPGVKRIAVFASAIQNEMKGECKHLCRGVPVMRRGCNGLLFGSALADYTVLESASV